MSHLKIIKEAYDKCGITYVIREKVEGRNTWRYLFLYGTEDRRLFLEKEDLKYLLSGGAKFIEFWNEKIASY